METAGSPPRPARRSPSTLLALAAGTALGLAAGVGGFTFGYAKGASYLGHDAAACANCHVMQGHYDAWLKSSHRAVAACNDCHTPGGFLPKYATKAENGFRHSFAFTTGRFPDTILITPRDHDIVEGACMKCHADVVEAIGGPHAAGGGTSCVRCHDSVGHAR